MKKVLLGFSTAIAISMYLSGSSFAEEVTRDQATSIDQAAPIDQEMSPLAIPKYSGPGTYYDMSTSTVNKEIQYTDYVTNSGGVTSDVTRSVSLRHYITTLLQSIITQRVH
jgi:small neutral amino acid transporter SnatA (MarC family)